MSERLDLSDITDQLQEICEESGFDFFMEYPDSTAVQNGRRPLAILTLGSIRHGGRAKKTNSALVLHGMTLTFRLKLTGRCCEATDAAELTGRVHEVMAAAVKLTDPVFSQIEQGEMTFEPRVRRLIRELTLSCTVCMEEEA